VILLSIHVPRYLMVSRLYVVYYVALFQHILFIMATVRRLMLFFVVLGSHVKKN